MIKNRIIFTLLYQEGGFYLSRNFRLQRVGDLSWLKANYGEGHLSKNVDEVVVLNVSKRPNSLEQFATDLPRIVSDWFLPVSAGGGIRSIQDAEKLLRSGADKVVLNYAIFNNSHLLQEIKGRYGLQSIVGSVDFKRTGETPVPFSSGGQKEESIQSLRKTLEREEIGELLIRSIDNDGSSNGLDLQLLDHLVGHLNPKVPLILAGGIGNPSHVHSALLRSDLNAVATANIFNFIGQGFARTRRYLKDSGVSLANWEET